MNNDPVWRNQIGMFKADDHCPPRQRSIYLRRLKALHDGKDTNGTPAISLQKKCDSAHYFRFFVNHWRVSTV